MEQCNMHGFDTFKSTRAPSTHPPHPEIHPTHMSRLYRSDLHLTFRDWSSSESEDEADNTTDNGIHTQTGSTSSQRITRSRARHLSAVTMSRINNNTDIQEPDTAARNSRVDTELLRTPSIFNRRSIMNTYHDEEAQDADNDSDDAVVDDTINRRTEEPPLEINGAPVNVSDSQDEGEISYDNIFSIRNNPAPLFDNAFNDETDHTTYYNRDTTNTNTPYNVSIDNSQEEERSVDNSNSSTPPHLLNRSINIPDFYALPGILTNDYASRCTNISGDTSFFKFHPEHETNCSIPNSIQKYGLINMMNNLMIHRNEHISSKSTDTNIKQLLESQTHNKKRNFNELCIDDLNLSFLLDPKVTPKVQQISPSTYLKTGSSYRLPISLNGFSSTLKFTDVNYNNLNISGLFQLGDVQLGFNGELVDFLKTDLRYTKDKKFLIEANVFSNLLRNKLIFSKKFKKIFDRRKKKYYTKNNWRPFSMNKMGYIVSNRNNNTYYYQSLLSSDSTAINPIKPTKFPNRSLFHKLQATNESKFDMFKLLSKWFEMPPLNQYINTPSPPTPPNRLTKYTNNPENLLVCHDCVNMMISKFVFLKLEIDIQDLFDANSSKSSLVYPDLVYKHRRRFQDYASKLMSKSNTNFRSHLERQFRESPNSSRPMYGILMGLNNEEDDDDDDDSDIDNGLDTIFNCTHNAFTTNPLEVNPVAHEEHENIENDEEYFNWQDSIDFRGISNDDMDNDSCDAFTKNDTEEDDDDIHRGYSEEERSNSNYRNHSILDAWPLSAERFSESHPIFEPEITSNEGDNTDDDYDNPYNIIFTNDRAGRVSRLLLNLNMNREQHRHKRVPISSLELYKNGGGSRLKMTMLVCINRNTGELHMLPGNMDVNMWSIEQNNGELFEDVETFSKVFKLFIGCGQEDDKDSQYAKKMKNWLNTNRAEEVDEIKKLMVLQLLTNPSIINGYNKRRDKHREKNKKQKVKFQQSKCDKVEKKGNQSILKNKKGKSNENKGLFKCSEHTTTTEHTGTLNTGQYNDDIKEHMLAFMGESFGFDIDNDKVLTFQYGQENGVTNKQGHGSLYSFEFA